MYGGRTVGMFGYSPFTDGFVDRQAEYTRVPYGDINLFEIARTIYQMRKVYTFQMSCV